MVVVGQLYSPAALPPVKESVVSIGKEAVGSTAGLDPVVVSKM
jgi:hypothetical protein